jgi:ammonia channel protein AmtB
MRIAKFLLDFGGGVFVLLGLLHALYTYLDIARPRRLVPQEPAVAQAMAESNMRLSGTGTTMWRAWVGFNFSHSIGVVLFGTVCIGAGSILGTMVLPAWILFVLVVIALLYFMVGLLYWFRVPVAGVAVAGVCLLIAWLMYAFAGV